MPATARSSVTSSSSPQEPKRDGKPPVESKAERRTTAAQGRNPSTDGPSPVKATRSVSSALTPASLAGRPTVGRELSHLDVRPRAAEVRRGVVAGPVVHHDGGR